MTVHPVASALLQIHQKAVVRSRITHRITDEITSAPRCIRKPSSHCSPMDQQSGRCAPIQALGKSHRVSCSMGGHFSTPIFTSNVAGQLISGDCLRGFADRAAVRVAPLNMHTWCVCGNVLKQEIMIISCSRLSASEVNETRRGLPISPAFRCAPPGIRFQPLMAIAEPR